MNTLRSATIGGLLLLAICAFELFNFDTTRFALSHLLGATALLAIPWSALLATAFCALDFAGLLHLFTPDPAEATPRYAWYLLAAWLCGGTLNALLTWYAVSLTLLEANAGTIILSQPQLLQVVPIGIALLVWLVRIFFISALAMMGEVLLPLSYLPTYRVVDQEPTQPRVSGRQRAFLRTSEEE